MVSIPNILIENYDNFHELIEDNVYTDTDSLHVEHDNVCLPYLLKHHINIMYQGFPRKVDTVKYNGEKMIKLLLNPSYFGRNK